MPSIAIALVLTVAPQSTAPVEVTPGVVEQLQAEAAAMQPLVTSPLANEFLKVIPCLPRIETPRVVLYDKAKGHALTQEQAAAMTPEQLEGHEETEIDEAYYYTTRYGTPVAFVRPLEILGQAGVKTADGLKLLDFGFGSIGQLRALASAGADAVGVEVDPLLEAIYAQPGDTGQVARCAAAAAGADADAAAAGEGRDGSVSLVFGRFPAEAPVVERVGGGYDAFISKNTLKRGYIHPERPVDPRRLVQLGVEDEAFVRAMFELLKPGGHALIYNLCPAPAKEDEPYIPWADGRSPFSRELYERVGFVVSAFDADDTGAARAMGAALGWAEQMDLESDLFGTYTLLLKPAGKP
jgi:hypothetical protein